MRQLLQFPQAVNETSARLVAAGVVLQAAAFLALRQWWLLVPLTYGFVARVLTGPRLSPLGQIVTRVITPRLAVPHRLVPGSPKRFAQGVGAVFSISASVAWAIGAAGLSLALVAGLAVAAFLEAAFALCLGCLAFTLLVRLGLVSQPLCPECGDLSGRHRSMG